MYFFNPVQDGPFQGCSRMGGGGGGQKGPPPPPPPHKRPQPTIGHTYPAHMKLGTVIPYLKKTQQI